MVELRIHNDHTEYEMLFYVYHQDEFEPDDNHYRKSILLKYFAPRNRSNNSSTRGNGYLFFTVIRFKSL